MYLPYWLLHVSASYELPEEVPDKVKYTGYISIIWAFVGTERL